jgi:hypothetical protein
VVVGLASDANLGMYLMKSDALEQFRKCGLCGSYECKKLWERIKNTDMAADPIVKDLADKLQIKPEGVVNLLREIAGDPYTEFYLECWAENMHGAL